MIEVQGLYVRRARHAPDQPAFDVMAGSAVTGTHGVYLPRRAWEDMGSPDAVIVQVRPASASERSGVVRLEDLDVPTP